MKVEDIFYAFIIFILFFSIGITNSLLEYLFRQNKGLPDVDMSKSTLGSNPLKLLMGTNMKDFIQQQSEIKLKSALDPIYNSTTDIISEVTSGLDEVNAMQFNFKKHMNSTFGELSNMGNMFNVITMQTQKMLAKLNDSFNRIFGTAMTIMNLMTVGNYTVQSLWNGEAGQTIQTLHYMGFCFHPETIVEMHDGNTKRLKNVKIGDVLKSGSRVLATLIIQGNNSHDTNPYYKLYSKHLKTWIYVTGSHKIRMNGKAIYVKDYPDIQLDKTVTTEEFRCLVTDDHNIILGEYHFYDWEY